MILGLLAGILWFAVFFAGHLAVARWAEPKTKPRLNQRLCIAGAVSLGVSLAPAVNLAEAEHLHRGGWWMAILWGELTYFGLFCLYTPFYYVVVASLSVRTIVMLLARPGHTLPVGALRNIFASRQLVDQRLVTMAENGFLVARDERYSLTPRGRRVAIGFEWLKRAWQLGAGG